MELIKPLTKTKEKKFWKIIESSKWVKYGEDYPTKHEDYFFKKLKYTSLDHQDFLEMENFVILLSVKLNKKFRKNSKYIGTESDSDWFDLTSNIIARGEKYYNDITKEEMKKLYRSGKCYEGFLTDFPYCHPWHLLQNNFLKTIIKFK